MLVEIILELMLLPLLIETIPFPADDEMLLELLWEYLCCWELSWFNFN